MTEHTPTGAEHRRFVLCADDFALTPGVSQAILTLLSHDRLSATCAMTNLPHWPVLAPALREHQDRADIGLHLNLTSGRPCAPMPRVAATGLLPDLPRLAQMAAMSATARREIADECVRQLDAFESAMGRPPDFVDGHRHVHVLPGIRSVLLETLEARARRTGHRPYLRDPADSLRAIRTRALCATKAIIVRSLAAGWGRAARARGFATNHGFAGFSDFRADGDYGAAFRTYLMRPGPAHLVMCHPGHVDAYLAPLDSVHGSRETEFAFLMSSRFDETLADTGLRLARFATAAMQP